MAQRKPHRRFNLLQNIVDDGLLQVVSQELLIIDEEQNNNSAQMGQYPVPVHSIRTLPGCLPPMPHMIVRSYAQQTGWQQSRRLVLCGHAPRSDALTRVLDRKSDKQVVVSSLCIFGVVVGQVGLGRLRQLDRASSVWGSI